MDTDLTFSSRRSPVVCLHGCVASSQSLASNVGLGEHNTDVNNAISKSVGHDNCSARKFDILSPPHNSGLLSFITFQFKFKIIVEYSENMNNWKKLKFIANELSSLVTNVNLSLVTNYYNRG